MDLQKQAYMIEYDVEQRTLDYGGPITNLKIFKKASALDNCGPDKAEA